MELFGPGGGNLALGTKSQNSVTIGAKEYFPLVVTERVAEWRSAVIARVTECCPQTAGINDLLPIIIPFGRPSSDVEVAKSDHLRWDVVRRGRKNTGADGPW